jgi:hypothetical protein
MDTVSIVSDTFPPVRGRTSPEAVTIAVTTVVQSKSITRKQAHAHPCNTADSDVVLSFFSSSGSSKQPLLPGQAEGEEAYFKDGHEETNDFDCDFLSCVYHPPFFPCEVKALKAKPDCGSASQ